MISFIVNAHNPEYTFIEIQIEDTITPYDLKEVDFPQIPSHKGVIISGRAPIWLHSAIAHECDPSLWVAHFDPRIGGGVVTQSHTPSKKVGDFIPCLPIKKCL